MGPLIFGALVAAIALVIATAFLRTATNWVCKFMPPFGMALYALFLVVLASVVISFFIPAAIMNNFILSKAIGFCIAAAVIGMIIRDPESGPIGFGRACLVWLVSLILSTVVFGGLALIVMFAMKAVL